MENKNLSSSSSKSNNWGGARRGAGRKCKGDTPRVTIGLRVPLEIKEKLKRISNERGISISEFITRLIEKL